MITNFFKNLWNKLFPKPEPVVEKPNTWTPSIELQEYIKSSTIESTPAPISIPEPIVAPAPTPTIEITDVTVVADSFEEIDNTEKAEVVNSKPERKKAPAKKTPVKKAAKKKAPIKKAPIKKAPVKKAPAKKVATKKVATKKTTKNKK